MLGLQGILLGLEGILLLKMLVFVNQIVDVRRRKCLVAFGHDESQIHVNCLYNCCRIEDSLLELELLLGVRSQIAKSTKGCQNKRS